MISHSETKERSLIIQPNLNLKDYITFNYKVITGGDKDVFKFWITGDFQGSAFLEIPNTDLEEVQSFIDDYRKKHNYDRNK